jgi:sulfhydrogenase subunit delta
MKQTKKIKLALVSMTSCEGCYVECLNLRERLVALADVAEFVEFRLFEDDHYFTAEGIDVAFVEGSPLTTENIENLKKLRESSKILIAMGSCAHLGGIYHLKNYHNEKKLLKHIYGEATGIEDIKVKPIADYVKVDFSLPQCPINGEEFLKFVFQLVIGKKPTIVQNPVCYECLAKGYECLLQKGEICLGAITQGGCGAICPKSKQACWGCRGLLKNPQIENLFKEFKNRGFSQGQIDKITRFFAVKEQIKKYENNQN